MYFVRLLAYSICSRWREILYLCVAHVYDMYSRCFCLRCERKTRNRKKKKEAKKERRKRKRKKNHKRLYSRLICIARPVLGK